MTTTCTLLDRIQTLPIELVREIKDRLDVETQLLLLKDKPTVYTNVNKTVQDNYVYRYLQTPSTRGLLRGLKKEKTRVRHAVRDKMGDSVSKVYLVDCELPGNVLANIYETTISKPMKKALAKAEQDAPMVVDLDGRLKSCITPLEKSIVARFKTMEAPVKPTYTNERTKMRYARALEDYNRAIPYRIYHLLNDFEKCTSFIRDLDYEIKMSVLKFLKTLSVLSKQYLPSEVNKLLSKQTPADVEVDKNRKAYYAKNVEEEKERLELRRMCTEEQQMRTFMFQEIRIREQQAKEQRKLDREEAKSRKLRENAEKKRIREERANKKVQADQVKALRALLRAQEKDRKLAEKKTKDAEKKIKDAEKMDREVYKALRTMFV